MDVCAIKILKILKDEFGSSGPFFLKREMKELNFTNVDNLNDSQKEELLENLVNNVFDVFSANKRSVIRTRLRSAMNFSENMQERFDRQMELNYLVS